MLVKLQKWKYNMNMYETEVNCMNKQEVVIADIVKKYDNPAAELVQVACQFHSTMLLTDESHRVNAKSMLGITAFQFAEGKKVGIEASGEDEDAAVRAMEDFLCCNM